MATFEEYKKSALKNISNYHNYAKYGDTIEMLNKTPGLFVYEIVHSENTLLIFFKSSCTIEEIVFAMPKDTVNGVNSIFSIFKHEETNSTCKRIEARNFSGKKEDLEKWAKYLCGAIKKCIGNKISYSFDQASEEQKELAIENVTKKAANISDEKEIGKIMGFITLIVENKRFMIENVLLKEKMGKLVKLLLERIEKICGNSKNDIEFIVEAMRKAFEDTSIDKNLYKVEFDELFFG